MNKKNNVIGYVLPLIITIGYGVYGTLIMSVIMAIEKVSYELAVTVVNTVISVTVIGIILLVKGKVGKVSLKSFFAGIGIYALPMTLFLIFSLVDALSWIFGKGRWFCPPNLNEMFWINLILCISIGVNEELVFRTVITNCLFRNKSYSKARIVIGCVYSAIVFGIMHIPNFIVDKQTEMNAKISNIIFVGVIGFVFQAIYLKTKNILVVMTLHAVWDFVNIWNTMMVTQRYGDDGKYVFMNRQIVILILMVIVTGIILWRSKSEDLTLYTQIDSETTNKSSLSDVV